MNLIFVILIAISLSMDAFSLALSFGTLGLSKKVIYMLSTSVGLFHFFMPLVGSVLGNVFKRNIHMDAHVISAAIFFYIAILMFKDFKGEDDESVKLSFLGILLFAFGVSLDSFGVGFALNLEWAERIQSFIIFTTCSFIFTLVGLKLGKVLNHIVGKYSVLIGAVVMCILAILNFCQFLF